MKNSAYGFNNKFNTGRGRINEVKNKSEEISQNETETDKIMENKNIKEYNEQA